MPDPLPEDDPRVPLAIERTLLAWTRTGLALMGFGFLVSRVVIGDHPERLPTIIGALLIALGAAVNITATAQYKFGRVDPASPGLMLSAMLSLFTGLLGAALGIYVAFF